MQENAGLRGTEVAHAEGETRPLLTPHACDLALGLDERERQSRYGALVRQAIEPGCIADLRLATNGGCGTWPTGAAHTAGVGS